MRIAALLLLGGLWVAATGATWATGAEAPTEDESEVKAAVVYHLSLFADWPQRPAGDGGFELCVLTEDDAMAEALARLGGKTVRGDGLRVTRKRPTQDLAGCRMLYLGVMSDAARARSIAQIRGRPVLSVSNGGGQAAGAIVSIGVSGGRVYFDIDLTAAQMVGLHLDAKLLRLARHVER